MEFNYLSKNVETQKTQRYVRGSLCFLCLRTVKVMLSTVLHTLI
jgi:hypothetical protein